MRYPADPPTVDEIVALLRHARVTVTAGVLGRSFFRAGLLLVGICRVGRKALHHVH